MGFRLQQNSMALNVNLLLCDQCHANCDQAAEATVGMLNEVRIFKLRF